MKTVLACFGVIAVIVVVRSQTHHECSGHDVSTCTNDCGATSTSGNTTTAPSNQQVACQHSECICADTCQQTSDCGACPNPNHQHNVALHCIDGVCICDANGGNHNNHNNNNGGTNHHPGGK